MPAAILMYHRVTERPTPDRYSVPVNHFREQMEWLSKNYAAVSLRELLDRVSTKKPIDERIAAITFDDAFKDAYEWAVPVLNSFNLTATFFIVSGLIGQRSYWLESNGLGDIPLMSWGDVNSLARASFEIGSHTHTHADLTRLPSDQVRKELAVSRQTLEDTLGQPVEFFAYPYGRYTSETISFVREAGFRAACSTDAGFSTDTADLFALRRIEVMNKDSFRTFTRKITFGANEFSSVDLIRYYRRRLNGRIFGI